MLDNLKPYVRGLLTYTPLAGRYTTPETGGTDNARYCYGVFLRHPALGRGGDLDTDGVANWNEFNIRFILDPNAVSNTIDGSTHPWLMDTETFR